MNTIEYSPLAEAYVPYIEYPELRRAARIRLIWEMIGTTPLPLMSRWVIYRAFRTL